jgi:hypothetical protein
MRHCLIWRTSTIPLKSSQPCDEIQEDLQICTSPININGSTETAIKFLLKRKVKKNEDINNYDPPWPSDE